MPFIKMGDVLAAMSCDLMIDWVETSKNPAYGPLRSLFDCAWKPPSKLPITDPSLLAMLFSSCLTH